MLQYSSTVCHCLFQVYNESTSKLQSLLNTPIEDTNCGVSDIHKTPAKKSSMSVLSGEIETNSKLVNDPRPNILKACKQVREA